jgi:hypothetical protein
MQPSRFKLIKIYLLTLEATKLLNFPDFTSTFRKSKFRRLCYQAVTSYHINVFTLILSLLEGRADIAWEPSDNKMLFLPTEIKFLSLLPHNILFASNLLLSFLTLSLFGSNASKVLQHVMNPHG